MATLSCAAALSFPYSPPPPSAPNPCPSNVSLSPPASTASATTASSSSTPPPASSSPSASPSNTAIPHLEPFSAGAKHWFNHLLYSPDGARFIFLHRWRGAREGASFATRMFTASATGKDHDYLDIPEGYEAGVVIKWGDPVQMFPNWSAATTTTDFVDAEITAHGVSVIEIEELFCTWRYIASSRFNRRITGETEMLITGPAAVKMPA